MAQFCLKRSLIAEHRIPKNLYVGDGMFIENLYNTNVDKFLIIEDVDTFTIRTSIFFHISTSVSEPGCLRLIKGVEHIPL